MIRTMRNGIKLCLLLFLSVQFSNCKNYTFLSRGAVLINDNSYYFNDSLKFMIELPGDFYGYNKVKNSGIKTDHFYKGDKKVLRELAYNPDNTSVLFCGKPDLSPFYNIIAVVRTKSTSSTKMSDSLRKQKIKNKEIAVGVIPFKNYEIHLIYHDTIGTECPYCDIEKITADNKIRLSELASSQVAYNDFDKCTSSNMAKEVALPHPQIPPPKKHFYILQIYKNNQADSTQELSQFNLIQDITPMPKVRLCPGSFQVKFTDETNKTVLDTTITVR
jgi:hypothetical protein